MWYAFVSFRAMGNKRCRNTDFGGGCRKDGSFSSSHHKYYTGCWSEDCSVCAIGTYIYKKKKNECEIMPGRDLGPTAALTINVLLPRRGPEWLS